MQKKLFYNAIILTVLLAVTSCGGKHGPKENPRIYELDETPDKAILVTLDDIEGDSIIVTPLDELDRQAFCFSKAKEDGNIKGSLTIGDTLSVFPDSRDIVISINVSELSGRWFYDMQEHRGLVFEANGAMSSINTLTMAYRQWKLLNGKLYIYYVDMQQTADERHQYLVEEATITSLDRDNLEMNFLGRDVKCRRQKGMIMFGSK